MSAGAITDLRLALTAVLHSSFLASRVQKSVLAPTSSSTQQTKADHSPVTLGDYAIQALVSSLLATHRPSDALIAEEASSELSKDTSLLSSVLAAAQESLTSAQSSSSTESKIWSSVPPKPSQSEWLSFLDRGSTHNLTSSGRVWTLDPIDGTKGFLRGGQYAVCLSLLEDGQPTLGVIGCPNLLVDPFSPSASSQRDSGDSPRGVLFYATRGQGAFQLPFPTAEKPSPTPEAISVPKPASVKESNFLESVEAAHSAHGTQGRIAQLLGIAKEPVRMDSQAKYCSLARGDGGVYMRLPVRGKGYVEKIWDHAPGVILVQEAGGVISDSRGQPLDFSLGRRLENNVGVVAAHKDIHAEVIEAVKKAFEEEAQEDAAKQAKV